MPPIEETQICSDPITYKPAAPACRVTVKKRGFAMTPDELIARLKLKGGGEERVLVLTRVQGKPALLVCR